MTDNADAQPHAEARIAYQWITAEAGHLRLEADQPVLPEWERLCAEVMGRSKREIGHVIIELLVFAGELVLGLRDARRDADSRRTWQWFADHLEGEHRQVRERRRAVEEGTSGPADAEAE